MVHRYTAAMIKHMASHVMAVGIVAQDGDKPGASRFRGYERHSGRLLFYIAEQLY